MITLKRFTAPWCAPCRMLSPLFKEMEKDMTDIKFETIDVEETPEIAAEHLVRSVPTVMIFKDDTVVASLVGAGSRPQYLALIEEARNA